MGDRAVVVFDDYKPLGYVRRSEIESVRGALGLPVERDLYWEAKGTIMDYAAANAAGCIVQLKEASV